MIFWLLGALLILSKLLPQSKVFEFEDYEFDKSDQKKIRELRNRILELEYNPNNPNQHKLGEWKREKSELLKNQNQ